MKAWRWWLALAALTLGADEAAAIVGAADDGAPYRDRLLPLPAFLRDDALAPGAAELLDAFRLTGFFLERELFAPRGLKLPEAREALLIALARGL